MAHKFSDEDKKKAIFEGMSPRRQKYIQERVGYERWNPFEAPKDPIDIRQDRGGRTAMVLVNEFFKSRPPGVVSKSYRQGVREMAIGVVNEDDRYAGMYAFCLWHSATLSKKTGA